MRDAVRAHHAFYATKVHDWEGSFSTTFGGDTEKLWRLPGPVSGLGFRTCLHYYSKLACTSIIAVPRKNALIEITSKTIL